MSPEQTDLFSQLRAVEARDEAMQRVEDAAPDEWKDAADATVLKLARTGLPFTTDGVWNLMPVKPPEPRALGPVMKRAADAGHIRATGRYVKSSEVSCHAREKKEWVGAVQTRQEAA